MFDTSLRNSFLVRADHGSAWSQAFTSLVGTNCGATAGCRLLLKTVGGFARCDCGSDVILNVEAVLSVGVVDRSVLTADVCAGLAQNLRGMESVRWPDCLSGEGALKWHLI